MDKRVYTLLNNLETDLGTYEKQEMSHMEVKRFSSRLTGRTSKKNRKKIAVAAACTVFVVAGLCTTVFSQQVYAQLQSISYEIAGLLGIQNDLDPYTTVVNKSVIKGDATVTLNEVILDKDELVVAMTQRFEEPITDWETNPRSLDAGITINGRSVSNGGSGFSSKTDDYSIKYLMNYKINKVNRNKEWDMEIKLIDNTNTDDTSECSFAFHTTGKQLSADTIKIPLSNGFTLPDGTNIILTEYTSNVLGPKIYFTSDASRLDYDLTLKGEDNLGNAVNFYLSSAEKGNGVLKLESLSGKIEEGITSLTLTPYGVAFPKGSGKLSNDYKEMGEPFTIKITN